MVCRCPPRSLGLWGRPLPDRAERSRWVPAATRSYRDARPDRSSSRFPPDLPAAGATFRRRCPQPPIGPPGVPEPAPAPTSPRPTPSCSGTPAAPLARLRPRNASDHRSTPGAGTTICPPAPDPWVPHGPETLRPGSWRSSPTLHSTAATLPPTTFPAWGSRCRPTPTPPQDLSTGDPDTPAAGRSPTDRPKGTPSRGTP